jgi:4-hydroxy-3-polyprenylbenzoate decarboxylase
VTELAAVFPKTVRTAPSQEVVATGDAVDLTELPVLTCWPQDAGPFITLPLVITKDPSSGKTNVGMYRMQVYDRATTGMHWQKHKDGAGQARGYEREGRRMEVAVAIGCDPATVFSAIAPLPPGVSELLFAGFLRGEGVPLVRAKTVDLLVPAEAEFVLEGYVDPAERRREGPFGDHTGFYSLDDDFPVFHVTAVTRRRNPVYLTTIVGKPPMEDGFLGEAVERLFLPLVKRMIPELVDMHLPVEGIFHNLMLVSIDKRYPGHARKTMHAIWGTGQMMFTKTIVVFDRDVNLRDLPALLWRALTAIDPERDIEFVHGPVDELDFASRLPCYGSKMGIDATRKWKEEGFARRWPDEIVMSDDVRSRIDAIWPELGIRLRR